VEEYNVVLKKKNGTLILRIERIKTDDN